MRFARGKTMNAHETTAKAGSGWAIVVLLLSLPSVLFVLAHLAAAPGGLPESLGFVLAWTLAITSMVGPLLTLAALVVTIAATFQGSISVPVRVVLWGIVLLSALAVLYMSQVPL
jgi:hypothetical protein